MRLRQAATRNVVQHTPVFATGAMFRAPGRMGLVPEFWQLRVQIGSGSVA
jgi:hypothetical protein